MDENPFQPPKSQREAILKKTSVPFVLGMVIAIGLIGYPGVKWAIKEYKVRQERHLPDVKNYMTFVEQTDDFQNETGTNYG